MASTTRLAQIDDLPEFVVKLHNLIDSMDIYDPRSREAEKGKYTYDYLRELIEEDPSSIIFSETESKFSGFLITRPDDDILWLCWFGVEVGFRGNSLGDLLIRDMISRAVGRGIHKIWCDTRANNNYSIAIMQKNGFKKLCDLKNHWFNQDYVLWEIFPMDRHEKADW